MEATHDDRGTGGVVSWVGGITLKVNGTAVNLRAGDNVLVDGQPVNLPYLQPPTVFVERSGSSLIVFTSIGLKVSLFNT